MTVLTIFEIFLKFDNFFKFGTFLTILSIFDNFDARGQFLTILQYVTLFGNVEILTDLKIYDFKFFYNLDNCGQF